ncbi:MAG: hypothetical protein RLZZ562_728, partial [Planctomycetota bacterium]
MHLTRRAVCALAPFAVRLLCLPAACAAATLLPAQSAPAPAPAQQNEPRAINVQNLAPHARSEVAAVVVPFAKGAVKDVPDLHVETRPTAWQPFGARWPDGSLRQALCLFRA